VLASQTLQLRNPKPAENSGMTTARSQYPSAWVISRRSISGMSCAAQMLVPSKALLASGTGAALTKLGACQNSEDDHGFEQVQSAFFIQTR
jgi:hypothetical protein